MNVRTICYVMVPALFCFVAGCVHERLSMLADVDAPDIQIEKNGMRGLCRVCLSIVRGVSKHI